jgi:hypothetical protein
MKRQALATSTEGGTEAIGGGLAMLAFLTDATRLASAFQ